MRSPAKLYRTAASVNMTPMIDVVFLLIIFFLVSSHLAKRESKLPLQLPTASRQPAAKSVIGRLVINVAADGNVTAGGSPVDSGRLTMVLRAHAAEKGVDAAVHIRSDASVDYAIAEPLLRAAAQAGISNITFAVQEQTSAAAQ
ncbi:MAG TPA: biopolymer transporter ExbD [Planctomycetaceae bacterium]|nr:biopolymer transporter ExbD [Planctomycetaceae bacterium]